MGMLDRPILHLTRRAARRAASDATDAENADRRFRPVALEAAVRADDAAVLATFAARSRDRAGLLEHLTVALDAARRARHLKRLALQGAAAARRLPPVEVPHEAVVGG